MADVNAQYNVAAPESLPVRIAAYQRRRMFDRFLQACGLPDPEATILDVGVTSDRTYEASNYLEAWYPHKHRVTACGVDDASFLAEIYEGMRFIKADALDLPFAERSYDVVHASAVIEHVGSAANQAKMIAEAARVCRRAFFITTPNRWFPVEFHTVLPLVHWLPPRVFRDIMRRTGRGFFAAEENLNLMTRTDLLRACSAAGLRDFDVRVETASLGFWPSNLLLIGLRRGGAA